ncbi:hypothetical protein EDB19DRAFT_1903674 [Suillus lakei]|nr:hypothetical protein EDB19DRAFT_1903674 [Suillus lakei]
MSPDMDMDSMLPSTNSALFNVPKLAEDGSNWITYKEQMLTVIGVRGLMYCIDSYAVKLVLFMINPKMSMLLNPDGSAPTQTEIKELNKKINEYLQKDSLKLEDSGKIWKEIYDIHEGKTDPPASTGSAPALKMHTIHWEKKNSPRTARLIEWCKINQDAQLKIFSNSAKDAKEEGCTHQQMTTQKNTYMQQLAAAVFTDDEDPKVREYFQAHPLAFVKPIQG